MTNEIVIAGAGTGEMTLTQEVKNALDDADVVFADRRLAELIPVGKKIVDIKNFADLENESGKILLLVSGDAGCFSLLTVVKKKFPGKKITVIPGISSLQVICAKAEETWQDAKILSGHGRALKESTFLTTVERNRLTILFCDSKISPSWACEKLLCLDVEVVIGSCLGGENERVFHGSPRDFADTEFPSLSIVIVRNENPYVPERLHLRDKDFLREGNIVMTNESVRAVIMSRLGLRADSVFWDIGSGSGSISVSAGNEFPFADVHAVEMNPTAAELTARNAMKFHLHNVTIHNARALEVFNALPIPTHVFIGGTDGELSGILQRLKPPVRVVIACVTIETFTEAYEIMKRWEKFEAVQISAVSTKNLTSSLTMMKANNPVMILSAEKSTFPANNPT